MLQNFLSPKTIEHDLPSLLIALAWNQKLANSDFFKYCVACSNFWFFQFENVFWKRFFPLIVLDHVIIIWKLIVFYCKLLQANFYLQGTLLLHELLILDVNACWCLKNMGVVCWIWSWEKKNKNQIKFQSIKCDKPSITWDRNILSS